MNASNTQGQESALQDPSINNDGYGNKWITFHSVKVNGLPISPNFRTLEECRAFFDQCNVPGARGISESFIIEDDSKIAFWIEDIFGGAA